VRRALSRKNVWESLPSPLKAVAGRVLGLIPLSIALGGRFRERLRFVEQAQWWPAERARAYQLAELRRICTLAYDESPFYRRMFSLVGFLPGDLKDPADLAQLPTIDKTTINEHMQEMCTIAPTSRHVDYVTTGGTSGTPVRFYMPADRSATEFAHLVASWHRAGYEVGARLAVLRGRVVAADRRGLRHAFDPLLRSHYYSNFHMDEESMRRYLAHIGTIGPCFLHVYPSAVAQLARAVTRGGEMPENVLGILAESENVYPDQRQFVERVFGRRMFSTYGHTEKLVAAAECEESTDYHVWPTYGMFELLDDDGKSVASPGCTGEIVGTGFISHVMPLIRYRTGDYATYVGQRCGACRREQTIIADIRGHNLQEILVTKHGAHITWTALNVHDDTFDRVLQFQIRQEVKGRATLLVVPAQGFGDVDRQRIAQTLRRKLDGQIDVELETAKTLPVTERGKAIYVDQRIAGIEQPGS
jgi:phenylacetate-CoA ligase